MSSVSDDIAKAVQDEETIGESVTTLLKQLAEKAKEAATTGADAVHQLFDDVVANAKQIADAVKANTSAEE